MGWGQRNARFYCEVDSARKHKEIILGDARSGIDITVAGEYGSLRIEVFACREEDHFNISFKPWRKSERCGPGVTIAHGVLNFDRHKDGNVTVRLDEKLVEAFTFMRAKEIMTEGIEEEPQQAYG